MLFLAAVNLSNWLQKQKKGGSMSMAGKTYEADNRTGSNVEGPDANRPLERLTATSIIGDKVENSQGEDLGTIDNLMINVRTGRVEYAVVEYGSFLGIGGKLFAIPFDELRVAPAEHAFIVNRDKDYLRMSPGFDKTHWPDTNDHTYYGDVDSYWGTTAMP
jgi:sporulation protein YlmC with PRC-barrel domain